MKSKSKKKDPLVRHRSTIVNTIVFAVGHTTTNIPDPFRTPKSSVVRPG